MKMVDPKYVQGFAKLVVLQVVLKLQYLMSNLLSSDVKTTKFRRHFSSILAIETWPQSHMAQCPTVYLVTF